MVPWYNVAYIPILGKHSWLFPANMFSRGILSYPLMPLPMCQSTIIRIDVCLWHSIPSHRHTTYYCVRPRRLLRCHVSALLPRLFAKTTRGFFNENQGMRYVFYVHHVVLLYCTRLHHIAQHCIVCCIMLYQLHHRMLPYRIIPYHIMPYHIIFYQINAYTYHMQ